MHQIKNISRKSNRQKGFTIVELMIAMTVFSVLLIIGLVGFLQVGKLFYKGVTISRTQEVARNIMDSLTADIRYSPTSVTTMANENTNTGKIIWYFCVGNHRYTFIQNFQAQPNKPAMIRNTVSGCPRPCISPCSDTLAGQDWLDPGMRISDLTVINTSNPTLPGFQRLYNISMNIIFGDDDLLDNPNSASAKCTAPPVGSQFCAATVLKTTVSIRP